MRLIPRIETWPWCLRIAQTVPGRLGILLLFALGLSIRRDHAFALVFVAGVVAFVPKRRWLMLLIGTLGWTFTYLWPTLEWAAVRAVARQAGIVLDLKTLAPISVVLALLCGTLVVSLAFRFRRSAFFRRPILALLVGYFAGLAVLSYAPMPGQIRLQGWAFMSAFGAYLWFVCYALTDRNSRDRSSPLFQLSTFLPFWVGAFRSGTPFGKGAAYLRKVEARDDRTLAITQLKGLKLLCWVLILSGATALFRKLVFGGPVPELDGPLARLQLSFPFSLNLPTFEASLKASAAGHPYEWFSCWIILLAAFFQSVLDMASGGNLVVACCRLAGFAALRNTYKPLYATTLVEFWNRYYYYFKELLVNVFFFPTYLRYFKGRPRLRMFAATVAAAGLGNFIYHFLRDTASIARYGLFHAAAGYHVYLFYCLVLAAGIGISQVRETAKTRKAPVTRWRKARASLGVIAFYCLLHVFDYSAVGYPLTVHFTYLLNLMPGWR